MMVLAMSNHALVALGRYALVNPPLVLTLGLPMGTG